MNFRVARVALGLASLLLFCTTSALGQESAADDAFNWMLQVTSPNQPPDFWDFSGGGLEASAGLYFPKCAPAKDLIGGPQPRPTSIQFVYRKEKEAARLRVSIRFDTADGESSQAREVPVGTYVIPQNESITLSELNQFGLDPIEIKLVNAKLSYSILPELVNKTPSLVVDNVDEDIASYTLYVRNKSSVPTEGLIVTVVGANGARDEHDLGANVPPLIGSGKTSQISILKKDSPANPIQLMIEAVDFENGTYEGDELRAVILEGRRVGRETQEQRITELVKKQLQNETADDAEKIEFLRSQVSALSVESEPQMVQSIMARFPTLTDSSEESVGVNVRYGLLLERGTFLNQLKMYVFELSRQLVPNVSLQQWWDATRGHCDVLVKSCGGNHP